MLQLNHIHWCFAEQPCRYLQQSTIDYSRYKVKHSDKSWCSVCWSKRELQKDRVLEEKYIQWCAVALKKKYHQQLMIDYSKYSEKENVQVTAFIDRMDLVYAAADIVISRSGASSVSELCIVGKPTIFIPSPNVSDAARAARTRQRGSSPWRLA